ncbi:MAG: helix-turn-helix domain-containing protein [Ardenticatenaceae bacterium]
MNGKENVQLEASGWKVSSVEEFLGLTKAEATYIDLKLALLDSYRTWRQQKQVSQVELAEQLELSESSIAKMEQGDPSVSLDLLVQSLLTLGVTPKHLAQIIASLEQTTSDPTTPSIFQTPWLFDPTYQDKTVGYKATFGEIRQNASDPRVGIRS